MNKPETSPGPPESHLMNTPLHERLLEFLDEATAIQVLLVLSEEDYCSRCGDTLPYCCYDPKE